jgi:hypothetical protein
MAKNYETFTLADALFPRPRPPMLVDKILPAGSVSIWYGYPGSLKSALLMDQCMAIATGSPWLIPMPHSGVTGGGYKTALTPVLWIDLDNGYEVTAERVAAFSRTYNAPTTTPFFFMCYPTPTIQAVRQNNIASLQAHIMQMSTQPRVIVIDTLLRAAHVKDENASEMDTVLNNLHKMAEDLKATLTLISHSKKENMGRAGNGLRGHSSIEGGVDYVFYVKRDEHSDTVQVENQKSRRKPVDTFSAKWTYNLDIDGESLYEARFYFDATVSLSKQQATVLNLCQKICDVLKANGAMSQSALYSKIRGFRKNFNDALDRVVNDGLVTKITGSIKGAIIYELV